MVPIEMVELERRVEDGQALLDALAEAGVEVRSAAWVRMAADYPWRMYVVTPLRDRVGGAEAYRVVVETFRRIGAPFDTGDLYVLAVGDRLAADLAALQRREPVRRANATFGWEVAEEVYVYPDPSWKAPQLTIYGQHNPGHPDDFLDLSFEPHRPGATSTVDGRTFPARPGLDWVVAVPEGASLEKDETGRQVLGWTLYGKRRRSTAADVLALARLGLRGFRVVTSPTGVVGL